VPFERYGKGIDNAHIDVFLSPRLRERLQETVRKLILEDVQTHARRTPEQLVSSEDLGSLREAYLGTFEAALEQAQGTAARDLLMLLQVALLKLLLEVVARENRAIQEEVKNAVHDGDARASGRNLELHDHLVVLTGEEAAINRRVLNLLFRQVRKLEGGHLSKLRGSVLGEPWPFPEAAFFNPVLLIPTLADVRALAQDYPIALLGENGECEWLYQTNQCISKVFQHYLPPWTQSPSRPPGAEPPSDPAQGERHDQGGLRGFLDTEILLRRFVAAEEYREARTSWLDEPGNLRRFLDVSDPAALEAELPPAGGLQTHPGWHPFRRAVTAEIHRCLEMHGLCRRLAWLYWLPGIRAQIGRPVPLSAVIDFVEGRLPRRRLVQRLESQRPGTDGSAVARVLERSVSEIKRLSQYGRTGHLDRYLVDFLTLRRDLKLAYRTYQAMDRIRLLDAPDEVRLSRSNASLIEFPCRGDLGPVLRRIRCHAVIKADVRGSTRITELLRAKGLNPASHFSLNFFDPVNKLLPEFGAEKLFVEGDAVILALYELDGEGVGMSVARACGLARKILQVVALQNVLNRRHGLPDLELGLGITFQPEEPNFLYDEGRRIMISGAINRADRLSACASQLRRSDFAPEHPAFRVAVVRDANPGSRGDDLLDFNVNGIRLEEAAFFKLQRELRLSQVRLPDGVPTDNLFFSANYPDANGRSRFLVVRHSPVRDWDGFTLGGVDRERRHFFEVVVDERLGNQVRRLMR
jgi:hypothetical protein